MKSKPSSLIKKKESTRTSLLDLLKTKYLYQDEYFKGRIKLLDDVDKVNFSGFIILSKVNSPFILGAVVPNVDVEAALSEIFEFALKTETIGLLAIIFTENDKPVFYRRNFHQSKFDEIQEFEYYYRSSGKEGFLFQEIRNKELKLLPISNKLENLFFEIHSCMRDIDGLHADEALEELCKILYVKIYHEELQEENVSKLLHSSNFGSCEEFASSIRRLYREAIDYDLRVFRLKIPQYERSRGVFNSPIRLSSACLFRCFQLIENFSLVHSRPDVKGRAFQRVLGRTVRSGMGQYFTPLPLCELMVAVIQPKIDELILDPFCGSGHFLSESLRFVANSTSTTSKSFHEFAFGKLHGIEKSDRMVRIAMTDMRLNGDGHSNIRCTDALLNFMNYPDIAPESFDIVLTNPPFGSLIGPEAINGLGKFELAYGRKGVPLEVLGLERSIQFLRPGGRLAIVLPDNILSADSYEFVREWLPKKVCLKAILSLPMETFAPYGANVKTSILFAQKWPSGATRENMGKVCLLKLESIGYDAAGRITEKSDIPNAIDKLKDFILKEGW